VLHKKVAEVDVGSDDYSTAFLGEVDDFNVGGSQQPKFGYVLRVATSSV